MRCVIHIFVNGILTRPGDADNWTGKAVTWTHLHTPHRAEKVEYFSGLITRTLLQGRRARKLAKTLRYYLAADFEIHLAGHSNGCDVILDALRLLEWPRIASLNLISAASAADCRKNGLNDTADSVGVVTVWIGEKDWALSLASTKTGWLLGFGTLGLTGPKNTTRPIRVIREPIGHGDWFDAARFDLTLERLTLERLTSTI